MACGSVIALASPGQSRAQPGGGVRLEGGYSNISQSGHEAKNGVTLGAVWRVSQTRLASLTSAAFTFAGDSATAAQLIGALAWRPSATSPWHTEGGVTGAAFGVYELGRGGNGSAYLRERLSFADGGFWAGGAVGHTSRDDISSHSTNADLGASLRFGGLETSVSWARTRSSDARLLEAAGIFLLRDGAVFDVDDRIVALRYERDRLRVDVSQTWRDGSHTTVTDQSAFFAAAEFAITPRFALALGAGRQLADPVRGAPDVQVVSAQIRMLVLPWRTVGGVEGSSRAYANLTPVPGGMLLTVRVAAAATQLVEVAGSFSGWEPVSVVRASDAWEARIVLPSGRHRVSVRIDGGPWRAPANLGKVRDEFGGTVGVIVVP